jgi:porin
MKMNPYIAHRYRCTWVLKITTVSLFLMSAMPFSVAAQSSDAGAAAEPQTEETLWTRDTFTGDWGGSRTKLSDKGIDFDFRLSQYYQNVVGGGVDQTGEYGGTMDYRLNIDGGKLFGATGLAVNMHARSRFGQDITAAAGDLTLVNTGMLMPSPGDYHGTDVTGLTVGYTFPFYRGRLGNVMAGKFDVIDLVTGFFPSVGYGQEGFMNANSMVTALPWFGAVAGLSLYGGWFVTINTEFQAAESGFLFTGTQNVSTSWGSISDSFDDGTWFAGFHRFFWKMDDKTGYLMIFGGYSTKEQASNDPHDFINLPGQGIESTEQKNPWDIALYVVQDVWQDKGDPTRKATMFIGGTMGPDNPQFAQWNMFANIQAFGLNESRPLDAMGAAVWVGGLSPNFKDLVSPVVELRNLWGVEAYYKVAITKWLQLTPNLQLVKNGRKTNNLAVIPGVRLVMDF